MGVIVITVKYVLYSLLEVLSTCTQTTNIVLNELVDFSGFEHCWKHCG